MVPALPTDQGKSVSRLLDVALDEAGLAEADRVVALVLSTGHSPPASSTYLARVQQERGVQGITNLISQVRDAGLQPTPSLASAIVREVGATDAAALDDLLPDAQRHTALGNAMIEALAKQGDTARARNLVRVMVADDNAPTIHALRAVVNALVRKGETKEAAAWVEQLGEAGVSDLPGGTLIGELVSEGMPEAAEQVLRTLASAGRPLQKYHVTPLLKWYRRRGDRSAESRIAGIAARGGLESSVVAVADPRSEASALEARLFSSIEGGGNPSERDFALAVRAWIRADDPERAEEVFDRLVERFDPPTPESYGNLMSGWRRARRPDRVLHWFDDMRSRGVRPSERHTSLLIHSYKEAGDTSTAAELETTLKAEGLPVTGRSPLHLHLEQLVDRGESPGSEDLLHLIEGYATRKDPSHAEDAFEWLTSIGVTPGEAEWNALFSAWSTVGRVEKMEDVLRRMATHGHEASDWQLRALAAGMQQAGGDVDIASLRRRYGLDETGRRTTLTAQVSEVLGSTAPTAPSLDRALDAAIRLDDARIGAELLDCAAGHSITVDLRKARRLLIVSRRTEEPDIAMQILTRLPLLNIEPDEYDYSEVLRALAAAGRSSDAQDVYDELRRNHAPNEFHLGALLQAYAKGGHPARTLELFDEAASSGIPRSRFHFGLAINASVALGDLARAVELLDTMLASDLTPTPVDLEVVLSAFRPDGAIEMASLIDRMSEAQVPIDGRHLHRLMRAWRLRGDLDQVQDTFDSLGSFSLRATAYHFTELVGAHLDSAQIEAATAHFQRALETDLLDQSLLSIFVEGAARLRRPDLADWAIADASRQGVTPDAAAVATLLVEERSSGEPVDPELLRSVLAELSHDDERGIHFVARRLAMAGAFAEVQFLRGLTDEGTDLDLELQAEEVIALAAAGSAAEAERAYWDMAPSARRLDARTLQVVVGALCRAQRSNAAVHAFRELTSVGTPSAKTVSNLMLLLTPSVPPAEIENLLRQAERATPLDPHEHGILFNVTLRAFARAQAHTDVLRLRDEMVDLGLPIDRFTIGPVQRVLEESDVLGSDEHRLRGTDSGLWEELGVLLDDVTHELTGPAVRIGGLTKRVRARAEALNDEDLSASVGNLILAVDALVDRLNEYAVLAQADAEEADFTVQEVLRWVVARTSRQASAADVIVQWNADNPRDGYGELRLRGQAVFFRIAIKALVMNAIESLAASDQQERRVWLSAMHTPAYPSAGWIDLYVRDNGPGIAAPIRDRIFERGFTTKEQRGLGLGLTLVESVVQLFGGTVTLSESATGAEFFLRFPALDLDSAADSNEEA